MEASVPQVRLHVSGRVQGVGFRWFVESEANRLGIGGWVRNLPDGRVEVEAAGAKPLLEELIARVKQGPPISRVTDVRQSWAEAAAAPGGFTIRHDQHP